MSQKHDKIDSRILNLLQEDCHQNITDIADKVGLSKSACHRRVGLLEEAGYIVGYTATIDPKKVGYDLTFIVDVALEVQSDKTMEAFESRVVSIPEVQACQLMTGVSDYILRVVAKDVEDFERIRHKLTRLPGVATIKSALVLRQIKMGHRIHLDS